MVGSATEAKVSLSPGASSQALLLLFEAVRGAVGPEVGRKTSPVRKSEWAPQFERQKPETERVEFNRESKCLEQAHRF